MKHHAGLWFLAFWAALLLAPLGVAHDASTASVLFTRTNYHAEDGHYDMVLYRVKPSGGTVTPLTPENHSIDYSGGSWSPNGSTVAYERSPQWTATQSQLFVVDRQGGSARQITKGPSLHTQASWGPDGTIAFFTYDTGRWCLGAVRADGTRQRILFCPPPISSSRADMDRSQPQWTLDGKSVDIEMAGYGADSSQWHSRVYRVNVYSGAVVLRTEQVFDHPDVNGYFHLLAIAPDGRHGVYPADRFILFDFATGMRRPLSIGGEWPLYSRDGCKIAFVQDMSTSPFRGRVFVMNADGSNVRPAVAHPDPNLSYYSIADWSSDGTRILVNATTPDNEPLLQIIDLTTGKATTVTEGAAGKGAWYSP